MVLCPCFCVKPMDTIALEDRRDATCFYYYCPAMWSSAAEEGLVKLQLAQNRAACLALHCNQRADINTMYASLSWLRVEGRLTASLILFIRNINVLKIPNGLHSQLTRNSRTNSKRTVLYRAIIAWNFLPSHIAQKNSKPGLTKLIKQHLTPLPYWT